MNRLKSLLDRELGLRHDDSYDFALQRLRVSKEDSWRGIQPSNNSSDFNPEPPIFAAKFAQCDGYRHILAIANEDGKIALQDTTKRNYDPEEKSLSAPQCHFNAVFDLEWAPNKMQFVSASGDHTAQLWEVTNSQLVKVSHYMGHTRSVKTATFRKNDASVFATGGRDGAIIIWDTRSKLNVDRTPRADNCIWSGHTGGTPGTPVSQKKRTRTPKLTTSGTSSSITGLAFQDENTLISCGAGDGLIKVWDLRRNYSTYKKEPLPKHSLPYAGTSTFKGFTNLIVNGAGTHLYANCMDNSIYCYNICSYAAKPLACYKGLLNSTFYIKSCLSPDNKYLLSGSSDEKAYIWNLKYPEQPLLSLVGHTVEVTCVAWGASHDHPIITCSDDARHKIWRIGPSELPEVLRSDKYRGYAECIRKHDRKQTASTHKYNLRDLESTPRSLKRFVEQNERTPSTNEQVSNKRSFLEMLGATACHMETSNDDQQPENKRPKTLESRGRRLFSPSTSNNAAASCSSSSVSPTVRSLSVHLQAIPEEPSTSSNICNSPISRHRMIVGNQENTLKTQSPPDASHQRTQNTATTTSPLCERAHNWSCTLQTSSVSPTLIPCSSNGASNLFSPTSNLPNYVVDGEAPHLGLFSPNKRKHKDKVDWLTNLRKQKLMSALRSTESTLTEKLHETAATSPRVRNLRESSPRLQITPRRRTSHAERQHDQSPSSSTPHSSAMHPKTPTSSRRNSETSILRFFSVQNQTRSCASRHDLEETDFSGLASSSSESVGATSTANPTAVID